MGFVGSSLRVGAVCVVLVLFLQSFGMFLFVGLSLTVRAIAVAGK